MSTNDEFDAKVRANIDDAVGKSSIADPKSKQLLHDILSITARLASKTRINDGDTEEEKNRKQFQQKYIECSLGVAALESSVKKIEDLPHK